MASNKTQNKTSQQKDIAVNQATANTQKIKINPVYFYVVFSLLAGLFVVYAFTGMWPKNENTFNSFALQAKSWLEGRLDLGQNYTHLELAIFEGKYFVSFPPFVSYVLLPFAVIFGTKTPDHWLALLSVLVAGIYAVKLYKSVRGNYTYALFLTIFLMLGCNTLFSSVNGWVWFIAQNFAFTLSLMSLYYAHHGKIGIALSLLACAVGCRPFQFVYVPIIIWLAVSDWSEKNTEKLDKCTSFVQKAILYVKDKWLSAICPLCIGISYMILNYMRFGSPFEFGHNYLPEFTEAELGQFHPQYIIQNLPSLFRLPQTTNGGALSFPTFNGMAIWLISPLFITFVVYIIYSAVKRNKLGKYSFLYWLLPCLLVLHIICITAHKTMGGWHFGNRYINDLLPFVFYGILKFMPEEENKVKWNFPLFILGMLINFVGTIATYNYWIQ